MAALVREAIALSGLEGLGVPRVMRFGLLPKSGRPYMVRELVEGNSLEELMGTSAPSQRVLMALVLAAEQLTLVHRAGFFHGDVKPANVIVGEQGSATLVDLGLSAPWRDAGTAAAGLTPRYAAPELLNGLPLTVRAEIYALGVTLREIVERGGDSLDAPLVRDLLVVAQRATAVEPEQRYPSADEFASALRSAASLGERSRHAQPAEEGGSPTALIWPIVGIEATAGRLLTAVIRMHAGQVLAISGLAGSGRSVLLRRLAWSLGVEGRPLVWVDEYLAAHLDALNAELSAHSEAQDLVILVDDADVLDGSVQEAVARARQTGASVVSVGEQAYGGQPEVFVLPRLPEHTATEVLRRAIPSLTPATAQKLYAAAQGLPGELKRLVTRLARNAVVSDSDVERLVSGIDDDLDKSDQTEPLPRALDLLARGRWTAAQRALSEVTDGDALVLAVARARLAVGLGDGRAALQAIEAVQTDAEARKGTDEAKLWQVWLARAHLALADYAQAVDLLKSVRSEPNAIGAEALAFEGLALSHTDDQKGARAALERSVSVARDARDQRVEGLALTCLGLVLQRGGANDEAREAYHQALKVARAAGDANMLGTAQVNLAVLLKVQGDIARAIEHFEAALDMGKRSGRRNTVRASLINLANLDLYLGRLARARINIQALEAQSDTLPANAKAQLFGLQAELHGRAGEIERSVEAYARCAAAYEELGDRSVGAEVYLESVLVEAQASQPDVDRMKETLANAERLLESDSAHVTLLCLAQARIALASGDEDTARSRLEQGLKSAQADGQRDYVWRILATRADLADRTGQHLTAQKDRTEAVTVLEQIGSRLPRDLREVFWNDPRRRELRSQVEVSLTSAPTQMPYTPLRQGVSNVSSPITALTSTPLEQRLAQLLEINRELLGELDLEKLCAKVVGHALDLLQAERGLVILQGDDDQLQVHTSSTRRGDPEHLEFSRSIAEQVIETREPIVSISARDDARMRGFSSVHQMALQSVACVPIMARLGAPIGALYLETRRKPGRAFDREVPTLRAFADQVALAIETAKLVTENRRRADELSEANERLTQAQGDLRELLDEKSNRLKRARKKLRDAHDTLYGHFGYQGMVGTGAAMRKVYSLIDRIKDTDVPVLITGESGTGKEVAARAIHRASTRGKAPFLGVNCGAIPEHLLESELFGNIRGAFTGADKDRKGLLREAEAGSVLLDEIGEMPQKMQAGLLRVLQERTVRPVGGSSEIPVGCRFIFATHRDLQQLVATNKFREDLFYRIHVVEVKLPPLRERLDDIPLLVDHFLGIFSARYKRERKSVTRAALRRLANFDWPGNVRQLEHVLLNAWVLGDDSEVDASDLELPGEARPPKSQPPARPLYPATEGELEDEARAQESKPKIDEPPARGGRKGTLSEHRRTEKERIIEALEACNWNRVKAAELSGIPRRTFYRRLREYNIQ